MFIRLGILAVLLSTAAIGQFFGLSSNSDGSLLYFASTLRLKDMAQPLNGKIFTASKDGIHLYRAQPRTSRNADARYCNVYGFRDYVGAEPASGGAVALFYVGHTNGCSYPVFTYCTHLTTGAGELTIAGGVARLSANGRFAAVYSPKTSRLSDGLGFELLDLQSGSRTLVQFPTAGYQVPAVVSWSGGRVIADDGTALVAFGNGGYLVRAGLPAEPFPVQSGIPRFIDSSGTKVLYLIRAGRAPLNLQDDGVYLLDLRTGASTSLFSFSADERASVRLAGMSDDARRVLYLRDGQVRLLDTATLVDSVLTDEAAEIPDAAISGDGKVVYAVTRQGGLLRINADNAGTVTVIRRTPYLDPPFGTISPGLAPVLTGSALSDSTIQGNPPFSSSLGGLTMWVGERKAAVIRLTPTSVRFLLPWDVAPGPARVMAEVPGDQTPFHFPEVELNTPEHRVLAGALARQDWTRTVVGPIKTGEIIHVYAVGLGPVSPEVPDGHAAPEAEPLARTVHTLSCSDAEVLYAGLSPGTVERVYQVDLRITAPPGYQKFSCTLGSSAPFPFLSLNIVE